MFINTVVKHFYNSKQFQFKYKVSHRIHSEDYENRIALKKMLNWTIINVQSIILFPVQYLI